MNRTVRAGAGLAVLAAAAIGLAGCGSGTTRDATTKAGGAPATNAAQLAVTLKEFSVETSAATVPAGDVKVTVQNDGKIEHELVVFRTDLEAVSLPMTAAGDRVDEEGTGVTHLDPEAEGVAGGTSKTITVALPKGRYLFVCNLAAHYGQGMHAVVTAV